MTISYVGSATGVTSATLPAHQTGDLLVYFAFRDGSATAPTIPSGKNLLGLAAAGTTCSGVMGWRVATSNAETSGTWTNATEVIVHVYRGTKPLSLGAYITNAGTAASVTYPALTLQNPYSTSWVAGFAGHRSIDTTLETAPTGMTARSTKVDATAEVSGHDTNGIVSSWSSQAVAVGGTASGWVTMLVELIEDNPAIAGISNTTTKVSTSASSLVLDKPFNCQVGDTLAAVVLYACTSTATASLPSGWAIPTNGQVLWDATSLSSLYIATRVVDGSEGATFTFDNTTAGSKLGTQGILHLITGAAPTASVDVAAKQQTTSTTTGTFPSVTTALASEFVLLGALLNAAATSATFNNIAPASTNIAGRADDASVPNGFSSIYFTAGAAGATGAKTVTTPTLTTGSDFKAVTLAFKPNIVGAATGTAAATATGAATAASPGASAGVGAAPGVGASAATTVGASAGTSAAAGVGRAAVPAIGAATGAGSASAVGLALALGDGTATGSGTTTASGASVAVSPGTSAGIGAATGIGAGAAAAAGAAAGVGAATGLVLQPAVGAASGVGAATAVGTSAAASPAAGAATGAASAVGGAQAKSVGASAATGAVTGAGQGRSYAVAASAGLGAATAVGKATTGAIGAAAGTGSGAAVGISPAASVGSSSASGLVYAIGAYVGWGPAVPQSTSWAAAPATAETWTPASAATDPWTPQTPTPKTWTAVATTPETWS